MGMIRAFILDLDNTIYPVNSIAHNVFKPLYALLEKHEAEIGDGNLEQIKKKLMKKAFQIIADEHGFSDDLKQKGTKLLRHTTYDYPMQAFEDYPLLKKFDQDKFLVTMGFTKMQQSKVRMLDINADFKEVFVSDPDTSTKTKKDIFKEIADKNGYRSNEILIIGDDPESEIKAGKELQMITVLYDKHGDYTGQEAHHHINHYSQLKAIVDKYDY